MKSYYILALHVHTRETNPPLTPHICQFLFGSKVRKFVTKLTKLAKIGKSFSFSKLKSTKVHRHEKSTPPPVRFLPLPLNFA